MPSYLALLTSLGLTAWLFRDDCSRRTAGSGALWIPGLWLAVAGSRPVADWLALAGLGGYAGPDTESNPVNTIFYGGLILAAVLVLTRRRFDWPALIRNNKALFLIYGYLALSALWSPEPFITFRRLFKDFGTVLVGLVILSESNPWVACRTLFVRLSYLLLPLSLVVAKYFPDIGRGSSRAGETMYTGLAIQKNTLGEVILVCGLFLLWDLISIQADRPEGVRRSARNGRLIMLVITICLLALANSATSILCFVVGGVLLIAFKRIASVRQGKRILRIGFVTAIILVAADKTLDISGAVIAMLGRNPTLTGRTDIWRVALSQQDRPIIGFGFYAFWDTPRAATVWDEVGNFVTKTVHNGYLESFLDGGFVGVTLLALLLLSCGRHAHRRLFSGADVGSIALTVWAVSLIYNNSESSYFRLDMLWFAFLVLTIDYPASSPLSEEAEARADSIATAA